MSGLVQPYPLHGSIESEDAKDILRKAIRSNRQSRSERLRHEADAAIADVVETIGEVASATCVATYAARPAEPRTTALLERLAARGTRILLPVLGAGLSRDWAEYAGPQDLQVRAPGRPPEPGTDPLGAESIAHADVIVAPALAVDSRGVRLGQGGGWYDRALEHARPDVKVVAIVFPEEVYDATDRPLPVEPHDRPVHAVATPLGWRWLP
ncbi:5-formyltetrahydrofolate cyclo-ligase [Cellulosimicrobium arenosum]|uniref:5-formyltetrahydrofolate cyclo-ligase n=1 Tax=Cellulosimicrobium arenosum TaxID=2708133 RepID=A0A927G968_9MICO|nr:5-formyltetrahydrofolate cyclo-ligase [Cellulosimicrobium arenosum]MBD8079008.1 5-formyltetrahydrofolate cyclo-ligase [Cellulosimicrobium arenosum]